MIDADVVAAVQRDHRLGDPLADQRRVGMRVAHTVPVDYDYVPGARKVADLFGQRLDQPAVAGVASGQCLSD